MAAVGGLIWHREIVMDIKDMDGDASVGTRTVPVVYGRDRALTLSLRSASLLAPRTWPSQRVKEQRLSRHRRYASGSAVRRETAARELVMTQLNGDMGVSQHHPHREHLVQPSRANRS